MMLRPSFSAFSRFFHLESWFRLLLLCVVTGIVAGLGALVFDVVLDGLSNSLLFAWLFRVNQDGYWLLIVIPAVGALAGGLVTFWLAPEASGHGTDAVIHAFHKNKGYIRPRVPLVKGVSSILTIGTGGSAGKEGPIAQIGAGFGSMLGSLLKLSVYDRRILMLAGVAGGVGAIFKAPLAGAFFAAEVLYRDPQFEHDAIIPCFFSSVTAYSVFTVFRGFNHILDFESISSLRFPSAGGNAFELIHYAILSVFCALVAYVFVKSLHVFEHRIFKPMPLSRAIRPALGGATVGFLAILLLLFTGCANATAHETLGGSHPSHIMSGGYEFLQAVLSSALDSHRSDPALSFKLAVFLGLVVGAKIVATACTVGSGGSGGLLFPALFLGGITGAAYSKLLRAFSDLGWIPEALQVTPQTRASMILVDGRRLLGVHQDTHRQPDHGQRDYRIVWPFGAVDDDLRLRVSTQPFLYRE
jgi:chloride channel protein, CIC family